MRIYLNALCTAGVNRFNDIFTSFYTRQWYDVTNDVTRASLTVEDRLVIKALRIENGWRCGSNDCGISCQTVETTHVFCAKSALIVKILLNLICIIIRRYIFKG